MYSKFVAILINSIFGVCFAYSVFIVCLFLENKWSLEIGIVIGFLIFNLTWLSLDVAYNEARLQKCGGGMFFRMSIIVPPIAITLILVGAIKVFF